MLKQSLNIKIIVSSEIIKAFEKFRIENDFEKEYGGILVGYYNATKKAYLISDITWPYKEDIQKKYRFVRKDPIHQSIMDELWKQSGYKKSYLGEWHTHNEVCPSPSLVDKNNWEKISKNNNNHDISFFVIVGRNDLFVWMCNSLTSTITRLNKTIENSEGVYYESP